MARLALYLALLPAGSLTFASVPIRRHEGHGEATTLVIPAGETPVSLEHSHMDHDDMNMASSFSIPMPAATTGVAAIASETAESQDHDHLTVTSETSAAGNSKPTQSSPAVVVTVASGAGMTALPWALAVVAGALGYVL